MDTPKLETPETAGRVKPLCPYFGSCGGCVYQDLAYEDELLLKAANLKQLFQERLGISREVFLPIVPSPEPYGYRSRLDLSFRRIRGETQLGFNVEGTRRGVPIDSCAIARPEISAFIPALKNLAEARLPENYRGANLVVKTDDSGKIRWGGIGRGSLQLSEANYLSMEIEGKKIFYSLDTFFQANLGILPKLIEKLRLLLRLSPETYLLDLYSGVGLFWVVFAGEARRVWAVEENRSAVRLAEWNRRFHGFSNVYLRGGRTEEALPEILQELGGKEAAAIVDPPRRGLTPLALEELAKAKTLTPLIYVSCHPESLVRDLRGFLEADWEIDAVIPFDFFPRTRHLEVAVRLLPHAG